jgi:hypothetical protein
MNTINILVQDNFFCSKQNIMAMYKSKVNAH